MDVLVHFVTKLLAHLEESIDQNKLKELLQYSKKLSQFESKTLLIRDVFVEVLDQGTFDCFIGLMASLWLLILLSDPSLNRFFSKLFD